MRRRAIATSEEAAVPAWFAALGCRGPARRSGGRNEVTAGLGRPSAGGRRTAGAARRSLRSRPVRAVRPLAASAPAGWRSEVVFVHGSSFAKVLVQFPPRSRRVVGEW